MWRSINVGKQWSDTDGEQRGYGDANNKYHERSTYLIGIQKYLNTEGFLEKSLNIKSALKSTCIGKTLKALKSACQ